MLAAKMNHSNVVQQVDRQRERKSHVIKSLMYYYNVYRCMALTMAATYPDITTNKRSLTDWKQKGGYDLLDCSWQGCVYRLNTLVGILETHPSTTQDLVGAEGFIIKLAKDPKFRECLQGVGVTWWPVMEALPVRLADKPTDPDLKTIEYFTLHLWPDGIFTEGTDEEIEQRYKYWYYPKVKGLATAK